MTGRRPFLLALGLAVSLLALLEAQSTVTTNPRITGEQGTVFTVGTGGATATATGTLTASSTAACTAANTTLTDLWTYTLPANTLNADGRGLRLTIHYTTAANANLKSTSILFGATTIGSRSTAGDNNFMQKFVIAIFRTGAATQLALEDLYYSPLGSNLGTGHLNMFTPAEAMSGPVVIKAQGQNGTASASDICVRAAVLETIR